jgi:hypothetical protein
MSKPSRAIFLRLNAAAVGAVLGIFLSKSLFSSPSAKDSTPLAVPVLCFAAFFVTSYLRNPYGELVRALGMTLILVTRQSGQIRRRYPSWRYIPSILRLRDRNPFPPSPNPWTYRPRPGARDDPEFSMLAALAALGAVGSAAGGSVPLLPSWMGALAGGGALAFAATLPTSAGDLARCMGMRAVAVAQEAWILQSDLRLLAKAGTVAGKITDKLLVLDRKHRIKDRVVSGVSFLYEQVLRATQQPQQQEEPPAGRPPRRTNDSGDTPDRPFEEPRVRRPPRRPNDFGDTPDWPHSRRPSPSGNDDERRWRQPDDDNPPARGGRPADRDGERFDDDREYRSRENGRRPPPPGRRQW